MKSSIEQDAFPDFCITSAPGELVHGIIHQVSHWSQLLRMSKEC